jgi:hypothetical protein
MRFFIILFTIFFLLTVFLGNSNLHIDNPFLSFIFYQLNIFVSYLPIFLIIFFAIFIIFLRRFYTEKKITPKVLFHNFIQILFGLTIAAFSAFVILLIIAFIELNIFSIVININPKIIGIQTETPEIYNNLKSSLQSPKIIVGEKNSKNVVVAIAKTAGGTDNLYGNKLINAVPNLFIYPINNAYNMMLLDNTLIINMLSSKDIEKISPLLGFLYVKENFPLRQIRSYPNVSIMNENSFLAFRKKDILEKNKKIDKEILKMQTAISSLSASIEISKEDVDKNKNLAGDILKQRDKEYNSCLSKGVYVKGKFVPENTEEFCKEILEKWDKDFSEQENSNSKLTKTIKKYEENLKEYQYFENYFKAYQKLNDVSSLNIPSELGVFEPQDSIRILFDNASPTSIADYLETLIHEYLHYASYTKGKRLDSSFFEEGLTAYFARQTIDNTMKVKTNIGYPILVKVIDELMKKNAEVDLAEIYFTKDQASLERKLNLVYGDNFYKDNIIQFESLLYITDPDLALKTANSIMKKIGGNPLSKEDILSTSSNTN